MNKFLPLHYLLLPIFFIFYNSSIYAVDRGPNDISLYGGHLNVDEGFENRNYGGIEANVYTELGYGLHLTASAADREESAKFYAAGLSYALENGLTPKFTIGSSSDNEDILPELYLDGRVVIDLGPSTGTLLTPSITYHDYRNGAETTTAGIAVAHYFKPFINGRYILGQGAVSGVWASPGDNFGHELSLGAALVFPKQGSIGISGVIGRIAYDSALGPGSVKNDFSGVRPHASYYLSSSIELFLQAEYLDTEEYDLYGGHLGIKFRF